MYPLNPSCPPHLRSRLYDEGVRILGTHPHMVDMAESRCVGDVYAFHCLSARACVRVYGRVCMRAVCVMSSTRAECMRYVRSWCSYNGLTPRNFDPVTQAQILAPAGQPWRRPAGLGRSPVRYRGT